MDTPKKPADLFRQRARDRQRRRERGVAGNRVQVGPRGPAEARLLTLTLIEQDVWTSRS